jgi:hypothetical protein
MTGSELRRYYHTKDGKDSGLTKAEAEEHGISSGRESAEWIMKMKKVNWKKWTPEMWIWATKQKSVCVSGGARGDIVTALSLVARSKAAVLRHIVVPGHIYSLPLVNEAILTSTSVNAGTLAEADEALCGVATQTINFEIVETS